MSEHILIVEPDPVAAEHTRNQLLQLGYLGTAVVDSPGAAWAALDQQRTDLVLVDVNVGGEGAGVVLAQRMRERHGVPWVLLVGAAADAARLRAHEYVSKPVAKRELQVTVAAALRAAELEERLRQSEDARREGHRRQHAILANIIDPAWMKDAAGRYLAVNRAWCELFGVRESEVIGKNAPPTLPAEMNRRFLEEDLLVMQTGNPRQAEESIRSGQGEMEWYDTFKAPVRNERNEIIGTVGIARNITHRKKLELALATQAETYRALLGTTLDGVIEVDPAQQIVAANQAYCRMLGYTRAEILQMRLPDVEAAESPEQVNQHFRQLQREGSGRFETRHRTKDGRLIDLEVSVTYIPNRGHFVVFFHDITGRKRAAQALLIESKRRRILFEESPDGIVIIDPQTARFLEFNTAVHQQLGYSREEFAQLSIFEVEAVESAVETKERIAEVVRKGRADFETLQRTRTGERRNVHVTAQIVEINGQAVYHCTWRDVTERKRVEFEMRRLNRALRAIIQCGQVLVRAQQEEELLRQICGIIVEVGGYRLAWVGYAEMDAAKTIRPLAQAGFAEGYLETIALTWSETERGRGPSGVALRNGQPCSVRDILTDTHFAPWRDEALKRGYASSLALPLKNAETTFGVLNIYSGIPDAFDAEETKLLAKLAEDLAYGIVVLRTRAAHAEAGKVQQANEQLLRLQGAALEAAANAIVITDREGLIQWANHAFVEMSGWPLAEALGKNPRELVKSGEHDAAFYRQMWDTILGGKVWRGEIVNRRRDGALRTEHMTITPLRSGSGEISHLIGIKQDITDQKAMEAHFLQAQRMEAIGALAGGIAHDLNNILAPISLVVGLLKDKLPAEGDRELVAMMQTSTRRGSEVIRQLLTFSRGQGGERSVIQLRHLINEMVVMMRETFPREINLELRLPAALWTVVADPTQFHQVLMNLCVNARDAMPAGGHLTVGAANVSLVAGDGRLPPSAQPGPYVVLEVSDTGHGIPPEIRQRIFDPFFTTKPPGKGTGLGLSTLLGIVRSHGGFVGVDSTPNQSTTFRVYLPAEPDGVEAPAEAQAAPVDPSPRRHTILVVDDERNIRDSTRAVLEEQRFEVLTAAHGDDALAQYLRHRAVISLVLTDVMMPMMNGVTLVRALRAIDPALKIIVTSGLAEESHQRELAALGVTSLLMKPCDRAALLEAVRHGLGKI